MKNFILLVLLSLIGHCSYSQCNIPYGKKTFSQFDVWSTVKGQKPKFSRTMYSDVTIDIAQGNTKDLIAIDGSILNGLTAIPTYYKHCSKSI